MGKAVYKADEVALAKLLGDEAAQVQEYAPISAMGLRKVRVKEDGTWDE